MKIFVAGATGVIGERLVPHLVADRHHVVALTRAQADARRLLAAGAEVTAVDLFDPSALVPALAGVEVVVNLASAIPPLSKMGRRSAWRMNDRLRTEGAATLAAAAQEAGAATFLQASVSMVYADGGDAWLTENAPVDPPASMVASALDAEAAAGRFTEGGGRGISLRIGRLYGPGDTSAELVAMLRAGRGMVVGDGANFVSSVHVDDAAHAVAAALELPAGVYNVTDDRPMPSLELTSTLAEAVNGRPPRRIPTWLARPLLGEATGVLTVSQRVSNRRFREASGWAPRYPDVTAGAGTLT